MAVNVYPKVLKIGTQASYNAIESKDNSVLYFTSDTRKLYKGSLDFSEYARYVNTKPTATADLAKGCVYMMADTGNVEFYDGSAWHVISLPTTTSFDGDSADDLHIPTTEAVKEYVLSVIGGSSEIVSDIRATTSEDSSLPGYVARGGATVTYGDDTQKVFQIPGVATELSAATNAAGQIVLAHTTGSDDTVTVPGVVTGIAGNTGATGNAKLDITTSDGVSTETITVPGVVTGITAATGTGSEGKFAVSTSTGSHADVVVPGVFKSVSWNATTRVLTFTDTSGVSTGTDHVIDIGKDVFIDPDANNRYENGNIYLYLNDGNGSTPTEIVIPVTGLITDYFGDDTSSVQVNIDNSTHKVTADVIRRPDVTPSGDNPGWENALKLSTTTGAVGLYVDLSDVEGNIDALAEAITWGTF